MVTKRRSAGEGSLFLRKDGRWCAQITLPDGKYKSYYARTRRDARVKLVKALQDLQGGILPPSERQTLADFLTNWLEVVARPTVGPTTYQRYEELIRLHILPVLGKRLLARLTAQELQGLYAAKLANLAPRTVHHVHAVLHHALADAVRWDLVPRNVCDLVDPPKGGETEIRTLTPPEARRFLAAVAGDRLEALYILVLHTGMREGEILALHWGDVDLDRGVLTTQRGLVPIRGQGLVERNLKTARSRRSITLAPAVVAALRAHRDRQLEEIREAGPAWDDRDLIFPNTVGRSMRASNLLCRSFWPLLEKAGLPHIRFHELRHSAASLLLSLGVHIKVVQELLGHTDPNITLRLYSHLMPTMQEDAVNKLGDLLRGE